MAPALKPGDERYIESRSRAYSVLVAVEEGISALLLVTLLALISLQVFTRYVLNSPFSWTEELARFVFIWFTFTAAALVTARRRNIVVQLYGGGKTGRWVSYIEVFAQLCVIVTSVVMTYGGVQLMRGAARLVSPGTSIPLSFVYAAATVGFALIAFHSVFSLYLSARYPSQFAGMQNPEKGGI